MPNALTAPHPDEIGAMFDAIPDMRDALNEADGSELIEMFDAFDVCATYTKSTRRLELAASMTPELVASHSRSQEGVQNRPPLFHESPAKAGFRLFWGADNGFKIAHGATPGAT